MKNLTMEAKTITPNTYGVWAINRTTKEEEKFSVQAFTRQEAMNIVRDFKDEEEAPDGYKIKVVAEMGTVEIDGQKVDNFENECSKYVDRCLSAKIKNNARSIGKVKELADVINDEKLLDKVLEIVGLTEFKEYID